MSTEHILARIQHEIATQAALCRAHGWTAVKPSLAKLHFGADGTQITAVIVLEQTDHDETIAPSPATLLAQSYSKLVEAVGAPVGTDVFAFLEAQRAELSAVHADLGVAKAETQALEAQLAQVRGVLEEALERTPDPARSTVQLAREVGEAKARAESRVNVDTRERQMSPLEAHLREELSKVYAELLTIDEQLRGALVWEMCRTGYAGDFIVRDLTLAAKEAVRVLYRAKQCECVVKGDGDERVPFDPFGVDATTRKDLSAPLDVEQVIATAVVVRDHKPYERKRPVKVYEPLFPDNDRKAHDASKGTAYCQEHDAVFLISEGCTAGVHVNDYSHLPPNMQPTSLSEMGLGADVAALKDRMLLAKYRRGYTEVLGRLANLLAARAARESERDDSEAAILAKVEQHFGRLASLEATALTHRERLCVLKPIEEYRELRAAAGKPTNVVDGAIQKLKGGQ